MRTVVGLFAALFMISASAHAQVINGEGTYEGSTLHDPPPETVTARGRGSDENKPEAATPHRERRE